MENKEPVHVSSIVRRVLQNLKPKSKEANTFREQSIDEIKASIEERERLRDAMQARWFVK